MKRSMFSRMGLVVLLFVAAPTACGGSEPPPEPYAPGPSASDRSDPPLDEPMQSGDQGLAGLSVAAVGDMMFGRTIGEWVLRDGPESVFDPRIADLLSTADLAIGNLESIPSRLGEPMQKGYTFRAPPEATASLLRGGFDVVSLANNHSLDFGREALDDGLRQLARADIQTVGAGRDAHEAYAPRVLRRNGLRVAFLGFVDVPPEGSGFSRDEWVASVDRPGVAWADLETVTDGVKAATAVADIVVVLFHFGLEFDDSPSTLQRQLAHAAVDAGALLVLGSHPHVVQQVEEYGQGLIAYSLGNFVFDGFDGVANESAILRATLEKGRVVAWDLVPVSINQFGLPVLPSTGD